MPAATSETFAASGRRRFLIDIFAFGVMVPAYSSLGAAAPLAGRRALSVLDVIPPALHPAIRGGSLRSDVANHVDRAAREAVGQGVPLHFPAGTYPMTTWAPPAGLTVSTDGRTTVFRQLDTRGRPQRFIEVFADGVRLWPGGSATIDGGMTPRGLNATGFNSGIRVHARRGVRIARFECGNVYGRNLGGDVLETGCDANGFLGTCNIGWLYGDNIYRNVLSITGGAAGSVAAAIQQGGCGLCVLDVEPDPTSARVGEWTIGRVEGHRATVAGDQAAGVDSVKIGSLDLDYKRPASVPEFNGGGVSARTSPTLFQVGLRYRNVANLRIDTARIANMPRAAIEDIGESARDTMSGTVSIGSLDIVNCGSASTFEVVTQKTRLLDIQNLNSTAKPSVGIATFLGGFRGTRIRVGRGRVNGTVVLGTKGDFVANGLTASAGGAAAFRNVQGLLQLVGSQIASQIAAFDNCTGAIDLSDTSVQAPVVSRSSARLRISRSQINGRAVN